MLGLFNLWKCQLLRDFTSAFSKSNKSQWECHKSAFKRHWQPYFSLFCIIPCAHQGLIERCEESIQAEREPRELNTEAGSLCHRISLWGRLPSAKQRHLAPWITELLSRSSSQSLQPRIAAAKNTMSSSQCLHFTIEFWTYLQILDISYKLDLLCILLFHSTLKK